MTRLFRSTSILKQADGIGVYILFPSFDPPAPELPPLYIWKRFSGNSVKYGTDAPEVSI